MTEKENYLRALAGEKPEWIPRFTFGMPGGPTAMVSPLILSYQRMSPTEGKDIWGVNYVPVEEAGGAKIPEPDNFILKDIRQWRDVIKAPDLSNCDFEGDAIKDLEKIDRENVAVVYDLNASFFQLFVSFMGFSEGLCAMFEEPDEVKALMEFLCDITVEINKKCIPLYKPDIVSLVDDTATWKSPFISVDMYRDIIKPYHKRNVELGVEIGCYADVHNCGRCEDLIDDWLEMGISAWNPAQTSNDLVGIKKKYGNKMVLCGCWDSQGRLNDPDVTEEEVKQAVYKTIDTFAPGGGYMFSGGFLGAVGDELSVRKNKWVSEAYEAYGRSYYANH